MIDKTNSTQVIQIEYYKRWVSDYLFKSANFALCLKVIDLFEETNELVFVSSREIFCEKITRNTSNNVSKNPHKIPQDNQW